MKHGKKTVWTGIAVLCLIACVLSLGFVWYASVSGSRDSDTKTDMKMEGLRLTLANLSAAQIQADKDFVQQIKDELGLLSMPLRSIVTQEKDKAIQNYVYGCVLRRDGDDFILPEDTTSIPMLEPQTCKETMPYTPDECDPFRDREGAFWSLLQGTEEKEYVLCAYRQIVDD